MRTRPRPGIGPAHFCAASSTVATTAGAFPEVIADGETGILVPPADARALADAIAALLADPGLRAAMGAAGTRRIEEQFSWRVCTTKTAALYEDVLAQRR